MGVKLVLKPESKQRQINDDKPVVVFLMGPTGAGKTDIAVELVKRLPCDIISVDSALVYRGLDIGTAKPEASVLAQAPHRLIDICNPDERYSAARFRHDARREIDAILAQGRLPLLVGGTMMYFRALANGLSELPAADTDIRQNLEQQAEREGWPAMHKRLCHIDPQAGQRIHPNDPQRIMRALEVYEKTGIPLSKLHGQAQALPYRIVRLVLTTEDRKILHQRIEQRFQRMMKQGFLAEVEGLYQRPELHHDLPSMRAVGYRQLWVYLQQTERAGTVDGADSRPVSLAAAVDLAIIATRQLAKRQLTWLRSEPVDTKWFAGDNKNILSNILNILGNIR